MEQIEISKINAEISKMMAETVKIGAETQKLNKEVKWYVPVLLVGAGSGATLAIVALVKLFL